MARLTARVAAAGLLDRCDPDSDSDYDGGSADDYEYGGLHTLPEGFGRLAYLPRPGLRKLYISDNGRLGALLDGLCSLVGLEELSLDSCGLRALPEGIGALTGLRKLALSHNRELVTLPGGLWSLVGLEAMWLAGCVLTALPEGLCSLVGLGLLDLQSCGLLQALPEGIGALAGLWKLDVTFSTGLTALPAGLGRLRNLKELDVNGCPGLAAALAIL